MNIDNYIESQYRELKDNINMEYIDLYKSFQSEKLREILSTLHYTLISNYKLMNKRLPTSDTTSHFWAADSRDLIYAIDMLYGLQNVLKDSGFAFKLDSYYAEIISVTKEVLSESGGSEIPAHMDKVQLYYTLPIFILQNTICTESKSNQRYSELKLIGEGSYAKVFKYKDSFYKKYFVLKRAKNDLNSKELKRFEREFEQMNFFNSPYIVDVYCYNYERHEYIMEYMDISLDKYIEKNNTTLSVSKRKNIIKQILHAFQYIHAQGKLHRDISPKNILLKIYDDVTVVKVSDFGLVKIPDSQLTAVDTEFKGYYNDPALRIEGFNTYGITHETYALTRLIYFIMTGKTNTSNIKNTTLKSFIQKGLSSDKKKRFQNVNELLEAIERI